MELREQPGTCQKMDAWLEHGDPRTWKWKDMMCISVVPMMCNEGWSAMGASGEASDWPQWYKDRHPSGYYYWYANETGGIMFRSVSGASHWNSTILNLERVSAIPLLTPGICCRQRSKLFCMPNITNEWTSTIMDLLFDEHLAMICTMDVLSQCTRILLPLSWPPRWPKPW